MTEQKTSKALNISLWVAQGLLATAFGMAGFMKLIMPTEELIAKGMGFVSEYGVGMVRFIGISEVMGALGLILPAVLRIKPILTSMAAIGIAIIMVLAAVYHFSHNEPIMPTIILLVLALFVAWGRLIKEPIKTK